MTVRLALFNAEAAQRHQPSSSEKTVRSCSRTGTKLDEGGKQTIGRYEWHRRVVVLGKVFHKMERVSVIEEIPSLREASIKS